MATLLSIICPCYNEEDVIKDSALKLNNLFNDLIEKRKIDPKSFVVFVNDGSKDLTWNIIKEVNNTNNRFRGINLSFNSGHQFALMAGMMYVKDKVDAAITIDVDLQDDLTCIEKMLDYYKEGNEVVYGVKTKREVDPVLKRATARTFYKVQKSMGIDIVDNHADFRLLSNKVLKSLAMFDESNLYLRGIIPSLGFKSAYVEDNIKERQIGKSKYTTKKMFKLATDGVTSFSSAPLKIVFWIGIVFLIVAFINAVDIIVGLINSTAQPGWSQIMLSIWFVGGTIMVSLGLVGVYIGKIFTEVKHRPQYVISEVLD